MKKKKRNEDVPSFVDIEADEDSSLDFEMEDESEDIDGLQEEEIEVKPRKNWHKFTEELANRYNAEEEEEESSEPSQLEEVTYTPQYMFMPDNKSPRLWIIRCVRNKEKDVAFKILNNVMQNEKDKLNATSDFNYFANDICSVVVKPDLFGYIYVESFSRQAVLDALYNIRLVNRQRISPVPLSEMVDVLTLKGMTDVRQGSFARIRKGKYRNDVCQIIEVISTEMVRVRIVPRLTNIPKLFNISDMDDKEVQTKTIDGKKVYIYKRETFIDGFLEKEVISSNLIFNSDISFEESKVFEKKKKYSLGEKIRVTRGDYTNTKGIIRNIERNEVEIEINNEMLRIDINDIEKNYCEGDRISYNGRNAMIVKIVNDDIRFIYTDTFGEGGQSKVDMIEPQIFDKGFEIIKNPNMNRIRRDPYLNMQVDIKKGDYKGFVGVVKDVYKDSCRVLLESNMKYINVDREHLVLKDYNAKRISPFDAMKQETSYEQFGKTPNVYQDFGKTPTHRSDFGKTPSYKSFGRTPSHRSDFGKTPNYKQDFGKTPNYKQDYGKTPNYKQDFGRTPNYKQDFGKTPNYKQDYGKTPNYQNSFTPGHRSDTAKTSHYEKGLQNKDREKGQNTSWLRDNTINNVLVIVDGEERVLKEIRNDKYILDDNRECKNISYVMPGRYDKVCVMEGSEKGMYGILIELENNMGVVRCDNNEVRSVDLKSLSKLNNSVLR